MFTAKVQFQSPICLLTRLMFGTIGRTNVSSLINSSLSIFVTQITHCKCSFCELINYNVLKGNKTLVRSIVIGLLAVIVSNMISKRLSAPKAGNAPKISFREASVPVKPVKWGVHQAAISTSGRVKALNRFELFSEVNGNFNQ